MKYTVLVENNVLTLCLSGELDSHCAAALREDIDYEINRHPCKKCVLDLEHVTFMDSSGLGVILGRYKKLGEMGATLSIHNPSRTIARLLRMSGVYSIIEVKEKVKGELS